MTRDPELRTTTTGVSVCTFTVAVNRRNKKQGEDEADYFRVTAWRGLAEICGKYLAKGRKVAVWGSVSLNTWEKDGKSGASLEVNADDAELLSPRNEQTGTQPAPVRDAQSNMEVVESKDLPF